MCIRDRVDYMAGAAASEMPLTWPDDALLAQMVASHTLSLIHI